MNAQQEERVGAGAPVETDFVAWNEAMVERYDIDRYYAQSHPLVRWVEQQRLRALDALAAPRPDEHLLEVGCGAGHVLSRFAGAHRVGIDLSVNMLARSRQRLGRAVGLARASAERLPFAAASFDVIVCTEVLEHTPDPAAVVAELMRVAGARGRVIVSVPNEANIDRAKRAIRRTPLLKRALRTLADEGNEWHLHDFDLAMLRRVVGSHAVIDRLIAVPNRLVPLRYVARLRATGATGGTT